MEELVNLLKEYHLTIASCESLTAGLFASRLAEVAGASSVLKGAFVTYHNEIKERIAHVDASIIQRYGVISKECAIAMAQQTRCLMNVDLCVSFTGNAGPDTMEGKPAGLVFCAISSKDEVCTYQFQYALERNVLRSKVVDEMCKYIIQYIKQR